MPIKKSKRKLRTSWKPRYRRDHETLAKDGTTDPIYLFQRRELVWVPEAIPSDWSSNDETLCDSSGEEVTAQDAIDVGAAIAVWVTEHVFLTREEGGEYGRAKSHRYPHGWRVYCVDAKGDLVDVLAKATEGGRYR